MSQENVDSLRAFLGTWNSAAGNLATRNRAEVDFSLLDPEVTYEDATLPDHVGEIYRGHEGVARATDRWIEAFEELRVELEQIVGTADCLVSIHRVHSRARHTGIEFEGRLAYAWTFRGERVIHFKSFLSREEALEAAGLSE